VVNIKRVKNLKKGQTINGPVLYWMSRDQRVNDNWALSYAIEVAENNDQPIMVAFNMVDHFLGATWRQYEFMIKGLRKVEARLDELNILFTVLLGDPSLTLPNFIRINNVSHLVTDFDPLRIKQNWQKQISEKIDIPFDVVDAHNIVPCFYLSQKEEYSAATFRPKLLKSLPEFLDEFPPIVKQQRKLKMQRTQWEAVTGTLKINRSARPVEWLVPGEQGAFAILDKFLEQRLNEYALKRSNPTENGCSGLSPYLHFGHISAQRIALEITRNFPRSVSTDAFLEQLVVRRELADNFCYYNPYYDSVNAFKPWAINSLNEHIADERAFIYSADQFESAQTHDEFWNAAQIQLTQSGTMHGYMRMYWAKKILEWTAGPEEALKIALYLNDKYQLDGRDPNGYTGCAWAIGGIHDRAWGIHKVFGKIRYMNRNGCERKFDVDRYIRSVLQITVKS